MKFCILCQNMYFIMVADDGILKYFCRNCSHIDETEKPEEVFSKLIQDNTAASYEHVINKYTKFDPTLPSIQGKCQNPSCESGDQDARIVYIRYDQEQMKFVFLCTVCDHSWIIT